MTAWIKNIKSVFSSHSDLFLAKGSKNESEKRKITNDKEIKPIENTENITEVTGYIKEISMLIFESEYKREESLIRQSSNMQTAFSFMSATLFMIAAIAVEYKEPLSYRFLLWAFSSIEFLLLVCLILATIAQRRVKRTDYTTIIETKESMEKDYIALSEKKYRDIQYIEFLGKIQKSLSEKNDDRVKWIQWSMGFFYSAIGASIFWFVFALIKMRGEIG